MSKVESKSGSVNNSIQSKNLENHVANQTVATPNYCDTGDSHSKHHLHNVNAFSTQQIESRLQNAEQRCTASGARFTTLRRNVYRLILESDKPIGAYELITNLQANRHKNHGTGAKMVAPPTIYRTLDFLLQFGFIHQLTSINAFVPCCHPRDAHNAIFLLCNQCQRVQECSSLPVHDVLNYVKDEVGFKVEQSVMELKGTCHDCLDSGNIHNSHDQEISG